MTELKRYNALKQVTAKSMNRQEYNDLRGWSLPADENGSDEGYLTVDINSEPNLAGYDGYVSWTPKVIFEDQFYEVSRQQACTAPKDDRELTDDEVKRIRETGSLCDCDDTYELTGDEQFDFGMAIHLLKEGERVMRAGWNGENMWLILVGADEYELEAYKYFNATERSPFIAMKTADNKIVPWLASQTDVLATDWMLVK